VLKRNFKIRLIPTAGARTAIAGNGPGPGSRFREGKASRMPPALKVLLKVKFLKDAKINTLISATYNLSSVSWSWCQPSSERLPAPITLHDYLFAQKQADCFFV
jgi:hypothetical protein